ncbi:T-cell surface protein tactile [Tamandua tetradactyla]|uniref:T-cell surface protein tactile n=1 Tax=Tamandua tetradactyla TaxID=48850 RepID=UPI0040542654
MEKKWAFCAVYSFIQILFVKGVWEETVDAEESIYALPGSDVNLTCQTRKNGFLVQVQWSKFTDTVDLVALYHPQHGFYCASGNPCESLVTFTEAPRNVLKWSLHLRNMSSSLSGKYQCRFTKFPEGIWTKIYNLLIQPNVIQDEWRTNQTIDGEINQALEIPCFQNISEISSVLTFAWLVEDNGTQETLIAQDHIISNSTWFKDRVRLGANYGLYLSSIQIHDDDRKFSCHVIIRPGKNWTRSSTVKVFAKPEIPMIMENISMDVLGEPQRTFTCSLRNVFPTANLTWFIDGGSLQGEKKEINIINEERKGKGGFLELKSVLTKVHINGAAQSMNLTIWCMALSPGPANRVWNISSEKISISLGSLYPPSDPPPKGTESTLSTQSSPANSITPTGKNVFILFSFLFMTLLGSVVNMPKDGTSWPVIVAALLLICLVIFVLGVRKWCEYQKEIMKRPPPFKPPPPPIKYVCIQDPTGSDLPCHEMETL